MSQCKASPKLILIDNGKTTYEIVISRSPDITQKKVAAILSGYLQRITDVHLKIVPEASPGATCIYIGRTPQTEAIYDRGIAAEGYVIKTEGNKLMICGGSGKGLTYGVYTFIDKYLGCKKLSNEPAIVPRTKTIEIPGDILLEESPAFTYREAYYPASATDAEYLDWHKLHRFEDLWGIWGHSFFKLVPPSPTYRSHPEYYALVNGKREATQLCLSSEGVFTLVVNELKKRMQENKDAMYWSVSPNDDNGYCQCELCKAKDAIDGGPQGSLIQFVNRVAAEFPDKTITTLAYNYSSHPTFKTKPAKNVVVMLSSIDANRDKSLADEATAASFRKDLAGWQKQTDNIFIWDYTTQFTNYLAPFPNQQTFQPNISFFKNNGVKGVFEQGSDYTYSEFAELKNYLLAELLWNPNADVKSLTDKFLTDYYGKAAPFIAKYMDRLHAEMQRSGRKLDIYGNPVNEWNSYLTPTLIDEYSAILDKAEAAVETDAVLTKHVMMARLPLEYTVLQQARFYGVEPHGMFEKDGSGKLTVRKAFSDKVGKFVVNCRIAGIKEMSEGGNSPEKYMEEWASIISQGGVENKATGTSVKLMYPYVTDYPAKGERTLIDGAKGYADYSYNWLCFNGVPMVATIDLGKSIAVNTVTMHFLDDPRHWIFIPRDVTVEISDDNKNFTNIGSAIFSSAQEHYENTQKEFKASTNKTARYIRVTANNLDALPDWRLRTGKKPMIACDEIFVN